MPSRVNSVRRSSAFSMICVLMSTSASTGPAGGCSTRVTPPGSSMGV
jgi:hypothetical protein